MSVRAKFWPGCSPTRRRKMESCTSSSRVKSARWKLPVMCRGAPWSTPSKNCGACRAAVGFGKSRIGFTNGFGQDSASQAAERLTIRIRRCLQASRECWSIHHAFRRCNAGCEFFRSLFGRAAPGLRKRALAGVRTKIFGEHRNGTYRNPAAERRHMLAQDVSRLREMEPSPGGPAQVLTHSLVVEGTPL